MSYEVRDNSGSIFINSKKQKVNHPDRQGSCKIDGTEYWISGWMKKDKNGNPWMSLSFTKKEPKPESGEGQSTSSHDFDDDIPF